MSNTQYVIGGIVPVEQGNPGAVLRSTLEHTPIQCVTDGAMVTFSATDIATYEKKHGSISGNLFVIAWALPKDHGGPKPPAIQPSALSFVKGGNSTLSAVIINPSSDTPMTWSAHPSKGSWGQLNTDTDKLLAQASQLLHVTVNKPGDAPSVTVTFSAAGGKTQFTITLHT